MKIHVLSEQAMRYVYRKNPPAEPHCVISICSPNQDGKRTGIQWKYLPCRTRWGLLKMEFHDVDDDSLFGGKIECKFEQEDARRIVDFWKQHAHIPLWFINCEAGISRSAGVAAALSKHVNGNDEEFFQRYLPNRRVYRMILEEFAVGHPCGSATQPDHPGPRV